ncbi:16S rRNA (uracil(1498)-N(3))-methyltransferase [Serinicoccus kebangsaanensis]|uniref:16S rRNA (uracil(1498)-N(3))-methyltransferase n=1 Tax=Serinicoccus kebangsaanensis TaxID=2602069 RepID=UPI00124E9CC8|nr:16S rRNA (uracil(1498)-N(3))-methyltransferase [Serinicoccus kebangsaanensis]
MSDPLFLVAPEQLRADRLRLDGPEGRHAATVQRIREGESVLVTDGAGHGARCRVVATDRAELELAVEERLDEPEPELRLVLAQALAKGDRDLQAIEAATELDVDEVIPWQAERSVVRWRGERAAKSWRRWDQSLVAATKQSRRMRRPLLREQVDRRALTERVGSCALALVLHEEATQPLATVELPATGDVLLVVGPEGGISPEELDALVAAGALPVRLGRTVLRTSTAGPAALAVLGAAGRWR